MKPTTMIVGVSLSIAAFVPFTVAAQQSSSQSTVERELHTLGLRTGEVVKLLEEIVMEGLNNL